MFSWANPVAARPAMIVTMAKKLFILVDGIGWLSGWLVNLKMFEVNVLAGEDCCQVCCCWNSLYTY